MQINPLNKDINHKPELCDRNVFFLQPLIAQTTTSISHLNPSSSTTSAMPSSGLEDKQQDSSTQTVDQKTGVLLNWFAISMNYGPLTLLGLIVFSFWRNDFLCVRVLSH